MSAALWGREGLCERWENGLWKETRGFRSPSHPNTTEQDVLTLHLLQAEILYFTFPAVQLVFEVRHV